MAAFSSLSDRLTATFRNLRTKGKLTPADVDGTVREIRRALLDADVALEVVKEFTGTVRERALSDEVNKALNPAQQVVQIVNEELIGILGGEQRRLQFAKKPPTDYASRPPPVVVSRAGPQRHVDRRRSYPWQTISTPMLAASIR